MVYIKEDRFWCAQMRLASHTSLTRRVFSADCDIVYERTQHQGHDSSLNRLSVGRILVGSGPAQDTILELLRHVDLFVQRTLNASLKHSDRLYDDCALMTGVGD